MRIAIVGAGISGLVCAHLLHEHHELTVFEANDYAGGHTHTVRVDTADETHHVDTGFIVHNDRNYPRFERLLESVGVATQPAPDELLGERRTRRPRVQRLLRQRPVREPRRTSSAPPSTGWCATSCASTARRPRWWA